MQRRIIISHIPRTGGTSLFCAIKSKLDKNSKCIELDSYSDAALMRDEELNSCDLITTYLGSRFLDRLDGSWLKIILFRDPLARILSSYCNLRNTTEEISFASNHAKSKTFRDYLATRDSSLEVQSANVQAWTVIGDKSVHFRKRIGSASVERLIDMAQERLKLYDVIGFTDTLDSCWAGICDQFNWYKSPLPTLRKNTANYNHEMEGADINDLNYHTELDNLLLAYVKSGNRK